MSTPAGPPVGAAGTLGLSDRVHACLFDVDGVLTQTATVHAALGKAMSGGYLRARQGGDRFGAFDPVGNYDACIDGNARAGGTRSFLAARGIRLPGGRPDDPPGARTVQGPGNRENDILLRGIGRDGLQACDGPVSYARAAGLRCAVATSSKNCAAVLAAGGIADLSGERVNGLTAERNNLPGKPAPGMYLGAARGLGVAPAGCAVFGEALPGVAAGTAGGFGFVVGADRAGQAPKPATRGAGVVAAGLTKRQAAP